MYARLLFINFRQDIPIVFRYKYVKKITLVQVMAHGLNGEMCGANALEGHKDGGERNRRGRPCYFRDV
jgi:hypothetical protein